MVRPAYCVLMLFSLAGPAFAGSIAVPNHSFEMPPVTRGEKNPFGALPFIDIWDETAVGLDDEMDQNTGVFINTAMGEPDHISNVDEDRLAFLSSLIGNDIRQELTETFTVGSAYSLTIGVATSLTFPVGATEELDIALFYFDNDVEQVIASVSVSGDEVTSNTINDFTVLLPTVEAGDAWAGMPIGILIRPSTEDPDDGAGEGFWDVDNVRLAQLDGIPAASTWGLIAMGAMLVGVGAVVVRRRALQPQVG